MGIAKHGYFSRVQFDGVKTNKNEAGEINLRPIIGVLAQECQPYFPEALCNTSYIAASYVKYVESGGARVVPVFINQAEEYYRTIFHSTNGLLIPGGDVSLDTGSGKLRLFIRMFKCCVCLNKRSNDIIFHYWNIFLS